MSNRLMLTGRARTQVNHFVNYNYQYNTNNNNNNNNPNPSLLHGHLCTHRSAAAWETADRDRGKR